MKAKRIIPCLDLKEGRVVKGVNFVNLVDAGDPVEIAKAYEKAGADEIVLLDITASNEGRKTMVDVVKKAAQNITIPVAIGGGISTIEDIENVLSAGASKISINSAAVKNPNFINECVEKFGKEKIVVAIDFKYNKEQDVAEVVVLGGQKGTGMDVVSWAKEVEQRGAGEILLTSMDCDGTKAGYDIETTRRVSEAVGIPVIASGGAGTKEDFLLALTEGCADAALAASLFHFKEIEIMDLKKYLQQNDVPVTLAE